MLISHILDRVSPGEPAAHSHFHVLIGIQPGTRTAAEGLLAGRAGRHFKEVIADILEDVPGFFEEAHAACRVAGVVKGHAMMVVTAGIELQLTMVDEIRSELDNVCHLRAAGIVEPGSGDGRNRHLEEVGGTVHGVHILVDDPPHVAAFAAQDPFDAQPLGFGVHLGIQPLHGLVGGEKPEVPALRGVGAPGVVQPDFVEEHQVAHEGVGAGIGKNVARGGDEEHFRSLPVERRLDPHAVYGFNLVYEKVNHVLVGMRLDAQVIAGLVAVGDRRGDPVDVAAHQVQQFAADDGDFGSVDPIGAEERAAAAFGALKEVVEPLLEDVHGKLTASGDLAHEFAGQGEVVAVNRTQQFRPKHRHVLGIAGTDKEVAFVRTGTAADANVHEKLE